jgi:hypothetical protein
MEENAKGSGKVGKTASSSNSLVAGSNPADTSQDSPSKNLRQE